MTIGHVKLHGIADTTNHTKVSLEELNTMVSGGLQIASTADLTGYAVLSGDNVFTGTNVINGSVTCNGTFTATSAIFIQTEQLELSSNFIDLNKNASGSPSEDAGIRVVRGDEPSAQIYFNETTDRWMFGVADDNQNFITSGDLGEYALSGHVHNEYSLTGHVHAISGITDLQTTLDSKASSSHTHSVSSIVDLSFTLANYSLTGHTHTEYSSTGHIHAISGITDLQATLDTKSSTAHTHSASGITDLSTTLSAYSLTGHTHNGLYAWSTLTTSATGVTGHGYELDASGNSIDFSFPSGAAVNDAIMLYSKNITNTVTLYGNGNNLRGSSESIIVDVPSAGMIWNYISTATGWALVSEIPVGLGNGYTVVTTDTNVTTTYKNTTLVLGRAADANKTFTLPTGTGAADDIYRFKNISDYTLTIQGATVGTDVVEVGSTASTIYLSSHIFSTGQVLKLTSGTYSGEYGVITATTSGTVTIAPAFTAAPTSGDTCTVYQGVDGAPSKNIGRYDDTWIQSIGSEWVRI